MTFAREHICGNKNCKVHRSYIRIKHKWIVIGEYGTICESFISLRALDRLSFVDKITWNQKT